MADTLEELAAQGRKKKKQSTRRARSAQPSKRRRGPSDLDRALAPQSSTLGVFVILGLGLVGGVVGVLGWLRVVDVAFEHWPAAEALWVLPALILAALMAGLGYVLTQAATTRAVAEQKKWLYALPFEFDVASYLSGLGRRYKDAHLEVIVEFGADIETDEDRAVVVDAAHGALNVERALCHVRSLELLSPSFSTYSSGQTSSGAGPDGSGAGSSSPEVYSNRPLHLWFRECVERLVLPLTQRYSVVIASAKVAGSRK